MNNDLSKILHNAYIKERKLSLLYNLLIEMEKENGDQDFFSNAKDDQQGDIEILQEINERYGSKEIEATIMEKLGESLLNIKSTHTDRQKILQQVFDFESDLVEDYKSSLPHLSADDQTRKMINRILTVKLVHKRDLLDKLNRY